MNIVATATQEKYKRLRKIRESLSEKGYRLTDQRILVLDAFLRNEELKDEARNRFEQREPKADLSRPVLTKTGEHSEREGPDSRDSVTRNVGECSEHLSAEDIAIQLREEGQRVSRSTVYRTLAILEKLGLVNKLDVGDGQSRYEFIQRNRHHHLICVKCVRFAHRRLRLTGKAIDISGKAIEAYAGKVSALADVLGEYFDFDVQSHRLEFLGICSECRRKR